MVSERHESPGRMQLLTSDSRKAYVSAIGSTTGLDSGGGKRKLYYQTFQKAFEV